MTTRTWKRAMDTHGVDYVSDDGLTAMKRGETQGWEIDVVDRPTPEAWWHLRPLFEGDTLREVKAWADEHLAYPYRP